MVRVVGKEGALGGGGGDEVEQLAARVALEIY